MFWIQAKVSTDVDEAQGKVWSNIVKEICRQEKSIMLEQPPFKHGIYP